MTGLSYNKSGMSGFLKQAVLKSLTAILNFFNSRFEEPLIFNSFVEFGYFFIEVSISWIISLNFSFTQKIYKRVYHL